MKEVKLNVGIDNHEPIGLGHLRGNFRQVLGACDADRDWQAKLVCTRRRIALAMSDGEPKRWLQPATSANASSIEIRSTRGVKSLSTAMVASPSRW